ncbi:MAG: hypothetical protein ACMG57_02220 [Candidatus Dojkabacteria bacterium]
MRFDFRSVPGGFSLDSSVPPEKVDVGNVMRENRLIQRQIWYKEIIDKAVTSAEELVSASKMSAVELKGILDLFERYLIKEQVLSIGGIVMIRTGFKIFLEKTVFPDSNKDTQMERIMEGINFAITKAWASAEVDTAFYDEIIEFAMYAELLQYNLPVYQLVKAIEIRRQFLIKIEEEN